MTARRTEVTDPDEARVDLDRLLRPSSVAVVGASEHGPGGAVIRALQSSGYPGEIVAVNPKYSKVFGVPCVPSVEARAGELDCVFIATNRRTVAEILDQSGRAGVGAAVVYAGGFGELGPEGRALEAEVAAVARRWGIALCGPNSMGVINGEMPMGLWIGTDYIPTELSGIAMISQSGGMIDAVRTSSMPFEPRLFVATGNEAFLTAGDFVNYFLDQPAIDVIGMVVEGVKDASRLRDALIRAQREEIPVVCMRVGRSPSGQVATLGHSGSLVSDANVFEAFLEQHNVVDVRELDEFVETLTLFGSHVKLNGAGVVLLGTSGGKAAHYADLAEEVGLELAALSLRSRRELAQILGPEYEGANPIDAGFGGVAIEKLRAVFEILMADEGIGLICLWGDPPVDDRLFAAYSGYVAAAIREAEDVSVAAATPVIFVNTRSVRNGSEVIKPQIPILQGASESVLAIDHLMRWETARDFPVVGHLVERNPDAQPGAQVLRLAEQAWADGDHDGASLLRPGAASALLREYGIQEVAGHAVDVDDLPEGTGAAPLADIADELGYPVVAKAHCPDQIHKSRSGLIALDLRSPVELRTAVESLQEVHAASCSIGHGLVVTVQRMVRGGLEVMAGVKVDPQFGPVLALGIGGVAVESLRRVSRAMLPLSREQLASFVESSPVARLLSSVPDPDTPALLSNLEGISRLAWDLRKVLREADFNPIIMLAGGMGAWCVDVRMFVVAE